MAVEAYGYNTSMVIHRDATTSATNPLVENRND